MALIARALATLDELKDELGIDPGDTTHDGTLSRRLNAASRGAYRESGGREFIPFGTNPQTRSYEIGRSTLVATDLGYMPPFRGNFDETQLAGAVVRELEIDDAAAITSVAVDGVGVDLAEISFLPRVREEWEPIEALRFSANVAGLVPGVLVAVEGTFGFPSVPDDLKTEVLEAARVGFIREAVQFSESFEDASDLPRSVRLGLETKPSWDVARSYRRSQYASTAAYGSLELAKRTDALQMPPLWPERW